MLHQQLPYFLLFIVLYACQNDSDIHKEQLEKIYTAAYPEPILIAPNTAQYISKTRAIEGFQLHIQHEDINKTLTTENFTQLSLRWANQESFILYQQFNPQKMAYDVFLHNITNNKQRLLPVPSSYSALPPMELHPSDSILAYVSTQNGIYLNEVSIYETTPIRKIAPVSLFSDFIWQTDGNLLYVNQALNAVSRYNPTDKSTTLLYQNTDLEITSITAGGQNSLLITAQQKGKPYRKAFKIKDGQVEVEWALDENIKAIFPYQEDLFVLNTNLGGLKNVKILNLKGKVLQTYQNYEVNRIQGDQIYFAKYDFYQPKTLVKTENNNTKSVSTTNINDYKNYHWKQLKLKNSLPVYLWKSQIKKNYCFIDVHGGPHLHSSPYWDATKSYLSQKGLTILSPNYRGSSGYTQDYKSNTSLAQQIEDLSTVVAYAKDTLGYAAEAIYFIGRSYGNSIIQSFLARNMDSNYGGWLMLGGLLEKMQTLPLNLKKPILAYYGQYDHAHFRDYQYLKAQKSKKIQVQVLKNEGHHFHHTASKINIWTEVMKWYFQRLL